MTVTIELSAEMERALEDMAAARGVALPDVIRSLLQDHLALPLPSISARQRAEAWRASAEGLPVQPPLSDEAISRTSIYLSRP